MTNRNLLSEKIVQSYRMHPMLKIFFIILLLLDLSFVVIAVTKQIFDSQFGKDLNKYLDYCEYAFGRPHAFTELLAYTNLMHLLNSRKLRPNRGKTKMELLLHAQRKVIQLLDDVYPKVNQLHSLKAEKLLPATRENLEKKWISFTYQNGIDGPYDLPTSLHMVFCMLL